MSTHPTSSQVINPVQEPTQTKKSCFQRPSVVVPVALIALGMVVGSALILTNVIPLKGYRPYVYAALGVGASGLILLGIVNRQAIAGLFSSKTSQEILETEKPFNGLTETVDNATRDFRLVLKGLRKTESVLFEEGELKVEIQEDQCDLESVAELLNAWKALAVKTWDEEQKPASTKMTEWATDEIKRILARRAELDSVGLSIKGDESPAIRGLKLLIQQAEVLRSFALGTETNFIKKSPKKARVMFDAYQQAAQILIGELTLTEKLKQAFEVLKSGHQDLFRVEEVCRPFEVLKEKATLKAIRKDIYNINFKKKDFKISEYLSNPEKVSEIKDKKLRGFVQSLVDSYKALREMSDHLPDEYGNKDKYRTEVEGLPKRLDIAIQYELKKTRDAKVRGDVIKNKLNTLYLESFWDDVKVVSNVLS